MTLTAVADKISRISEKITSHMRLQSDLPDQVLLSLNNEFLFLRSTEDRSEKNCENWI